MNSMVEVLANYANDEPEKLFIADSYGNQFTYLQAWNKVKQIAFNLKNYHDVCIGDKVLVQCNQDALFLLVDFACELLGAIFVPVEQMASNDRKLTIAKETSAKIWISRNDDWKYISNVYFENLIVSDEINEEYVFPKKKAIAEILYTTGTTGASKGIIISNAANIALAENIKYGVDMKPNNVELIPIPISHSHGIRCCYANLLNGGTIVLVDGLMRIKQVFELIDKYKVTALDLSPSAAQLLIKVSKGKFWEFGRRMDYIQIGTAALPELLKEQLLAELPDVRLYNFYGSTESGRSCVLDFSKAKGKKNCIGKPTKNAQIVFTDENRKIIKASETNPGLLASQGAMNMDGYWKNEELTKEIMHDGYVYTNDLGYTDSDGFVYVIGRKDDVINYNGIKISPEEVEQVACNYDGIKDCACVPMNDLIAGQVPRLCIVIDDMINFDLKKYIEFLSTHLDGNKVPKRVEIVDSIPRTSNGKIKRRELV